MAKISGCEYVSTEMNKMITDFNSGKQYEATDLVIQFKKELCQVCCEPLTVVGSSVPEHPEFCEGTSDSMYVVSSECTSGCPMGYEIILIVKNNKAEVVLRKLDLASFTVHHASLNVPEDDDYEECDEDCENCESGCEGEEDDEDEDEDDEDDEDDDGACYRSSYIIGCVLTKTFDLPHFRNDFDSIATKMLLSDENLEKIATVLNDCDDLNYNLTGVMLKEVKEKLGGALFCPALISIFGHMSMVAKEASDKAQELYDEFVERINNDPCHGSIPENFLLESFLQEKGIDSVRDAILWDDVFTLYENGIGN